MKNIVVRPGVERRLDIAHVVQLSKQADILKGAGHPKLGYLMLLQVGDILAVKDHLPTGGLVDSGDDVKKCGFTRAIGPNNAGNRILLNIKRHVLNRFDAAEIDGDVLAGEYGAAHFFSSFLLLLTNLFFTHR